MGDWFEVRALIGPLLDILALWVVIYATLRFLRGSRGLGILRGLLIIFALLGLTRAVFEHVFRIKLTALTFLSNESFPYLFLAVVIVFQPEIRRGFRRLGEYPLFRLLARGYEYEKTPLGAIAEACQRLARRKIGALIVIERMTGIRSITEQGVHLGSQVDSLLIETIFNPDAPLHDGAVIIRGDRLLACCCFFPLTDSAVGRHLGTRHRAAIGATEETDAVALVVSEETGAISLSVGGELYEVEHPAELETMLSDLLEGNDAQFEDRGNSKIDERPTKATPTENAPKQPPRIAKPM